MKEKINLYWAQFVQFGNRQWWGLKLFYWLAICLVLIITVGYFLFRKPKIRKPKKK